MTTSAKRILDAARPWLRWGVGVVAPAGCAAASIDIFDAMPFEPAIPRIAALGFTAVIVSTMLLSNVRLSRCGGSAFRAGVLSMAALYALAHSVFLAPVLAIGLLIPLLMPFAISPPLAVYVYVDAVSEEWRRLQPPRSGRTWMKLAAGIAAPSLIGASLAIGARSFERRIVQLHVESPPPHPTGSLQRFRSVSGLHDWSLLMDIARDGEPLAPADSRARRAWIALLELVGEQRASTIFPYD